MDGWWKSAVIYQIYPRSFQDSDGDGIGDLRGIVRRLDHVASLGVDAIWICPFYPSPMEDMGYDISDHTGIDPLFGTLEDFQQLLNSAHGLGLRVIIDQIPGHTSDRHPWFQASRASRAGDKADWYVWADARPDGTPPNNWLSVFGGPAWTWEPRRRQYYLHHFLPSQPHLNFFNNSGVEAVLDAMRVWLERGVDGFRLDSINYPFHDPLLRSNPPRPDVDDEDWVNPYNVQAHVYDKNRPETIEFVERVRALTDRFPDRITIGEIGEGKGAAALMRDYTAGNRRLHMAYSFEMLSKDYSASHFRGAVSGFFDGSDQGWPCWAFSNHDVVRHATRWGGTDPDAVARQAIALLMSLEGAKCLYQGEELGQTETELALDEIRDPPGRTFWPEYKGRDGCRTPMVWESDAPNAGFTTGKPWLPVKGPQAARAIDGQEKDPDSILNHYRRVLAFYRSPDGAPLREGKTAFLNLPEPILGFWRDDILCLFNLAGHPAGIAFQGRLEATGPIRAAWSAGVVRLPAYGWTWGIATDRSEISIRVSASA